MPCSTPPPTPLAPTWRRRLAERIRTRPIGVVAVAIAVAGGPYFAGLVFPEAPVEKRLFGGLVLGAYFALCAVPEEFLEP